MNLSLLESILKKEEPCQCYDHFNHADALTIKDQSFLLVSSTRTSFWLSCRSETRQFYRFTRIVRVSLTQSCDVAVSGTVIGRFALLDFAEVKASRASTHIQVVPTYFTYGSTVVAVKAMKYCS